ncbi:MAG: c-type cytochrome [Verrucomicrobia bacterium]|nr:c-type cytochrome [Verrucomicrobiota bacterium]
MFTGEVPNLASVKYGNFGKLLVFKLGGDAELPPPTVLDRTIPRQPELMASAEEVQLGKEGYHLNCAVCHGALVKSSGVIKDLRMMQPETHKIYKEIVLGGVYAEIGMASFADLLDETDIEHIRAYIVSRANEDREAAATVEE